MKTITLALYKGNGNIVDKLIRLWTKSKYSHTELIIDGYWYTSTTRSTNNINGVQRRYFSPTEGHWDYVDIIIDETKIKEILRFFDGEIGKGYDWLGIFASQILPLNKESKNKWFCSEICTQMLKISGLKFEHKSSFYSPEKLFQCVKDRGIFREG